MNFIRPLSVLMIFLFWNGISYADTADKSDYINCVEAMQESETLNARDLWEAAGKCIKVNNSYAMTFLLLSGQIRAMTDMALLKPVSETEEDKMGELAIMLYYQTGGSGDMEIYRSKEKSAKLFEQLAKWSPELTSSYMPGWNYKDIQDSGRYMQMLACQRAIRVEKLKVYASLVSDDEYYFTSKEFDAFRKANPGPYTQGTESYKKMTYYSKRMRDVKPTYSGTDANLEECYVFNDYDYEPDSDSNFFQVHTGGNGPANADTQSYTSQLEVLNSWIAKALTPDELEALLEKIDFEKQVLVTISFGKRSNATGTIHISEVDSDLMVTGLLGVNESDCKKANKESYPFALAIAPKPEKDSGSTGYFAQNFGDGCKTVMEGVASE
ncbi:MAG: hypothetical protein HKO58_05070 [Gammaproteobacteria bacterium]|nr:hypothetical protein [Gammaproteobacteria bacterium]